MPQGPDAYRAETDIFPNLQKICWSGSNNEQEVTRRQLETNTVNIKQAGSEGHPWR